MAALVVSAGIARADFLISKDSTQNISCDAGVCTPTAKNAVLNVDDLTNMLAKGNITVQTSDDLNTPGGIEIIDGFSWTSASRLTISARHTIFIKAPVVVAGNGALTLTYGTFNHDSNLIFQNGKIDFLDLKSSLIINDVQYRLDGDIASLANDITKNQSGAFALANNYDASPDGVYPNCAIETFAGTFEGLGHQIEKFSSTVVDKRAGTGGFFCILERAVVRDLALPNVDVEGGHVAGALVGQVDANAYIVAVSSSGFVRSTFAGGLAGFVESGNILRSHSDAKITGKGKGYPGGLVGSLNNGSIDQSYATGTVKARDGGGGLLGWLQSDGTNHAVISNSYATGTIGTNLSGGLFRQTEPVGVVEQSYSVGRVEGSDSGGITGYQDANLTMRNVYWDVNTTGQSDGCGDLDTDCPAAVGLSDTQLKSGLPKGFDPKIWGQSPSINNGYPYLLANPPQ